jgi:hypothetical protein
MVRQRTAAGERPKRGIPPSLRLATLALLCCNAYDSDSLERVILEVGQISSPSVQATGATATLEITSPTGPTLETRLARIEEVTPALTRNTAIPRP